MKENVSGCFFLNTVYIQHCRIQCMHRQISGQRKTQ